MPLQENENILVSSCGDGTIKVWDVQAPQHANPLRSLEEHTREVRLHASSKGAIAVLAALVHYPV